MLLQQGIFGHRILGPADVQHQIGALHQELPIGRVQSDEFFSHAEGSIVFEALIQHFGIIEPAVEITGVQRFASFKNELGIFIFRKPRAQFSQPPHRYRVIGNLEHGSADQVF